MSRWAAAFTASLAGRLVLILTVGFAAAATLSLLLAEQARRHDFERFRLDRVVASAVDIAGRLERDSKGTQQALRDFQIIGAQIAPRSVKLDSSDPALTDMLAARLHSKARPRAAQVPVDYCFPQPFDVSTRAAGADPMVLDCWYVEFTDKNGVAWRLAIDLPPFRVPPSTTLDPIFLLGILGGSALLAVIVARLSTRPLRRLSDAAQAFSLSIDSEAIPEGGPSEVRTALATFNLMQDRIRQGFRERTQILAGIAHDLQTPLTRLRLRLEQVEEPVLRERLVSDLSAMQSLVKDGLDLARSSETREPWSIVDIDSLLSSLCEDAGEFGANVTFINGCGARLRVKPNALARCLNNLIDNAIKHAGDAAVDCIKAQNHVVLRVRDHGPGIEAQRLPMLFEPFSRGPTNQSGQSGGTGLGLGLAIVKALAASFGATVSLENNPSGGVTASIRILGN